MYQSLYPYYITAILYYVITVQGVPVLYSLFGERFTSSRAIGFNACV